jgi:hypothetical protein
MADILCGYTADRDETLVAYLYDDIEEAQRAAFEAHIATCERCRHELAELQGVRGRLREWTTPESVRPLAAVPAPRAAATSARPGAWSALSEIPAWAQVAAAMLVLGVSARVANLDVHYDRGGLTVRTGWSRPAAPTEASRTPDAPPVQRAGAATTPWRADLDALERRLRTELHPASATASALAAHDDRNLAVANADAQLLKKVRALVDDSERRQRNELALGLAGVVQEFNAKRGTDLAKIGYLNTQQNATGIEVVRQQGWIDYLKTASLQK